MLKYKNFFLSFFLTLTIFLPAQSYSQNNQSFILGDLDRINMVDVAYFLTLKTSTQDLLNSLEDMINTLPIAETIFPGSMAAIMCDFRRLFCGALGLVIVAVSIFLLGLMTLAQKMKWPYAVLMSIFIIIFTQPEAITQQVVKGMLFDFGFVTTLCPCVNIIGGDITE